MIVYKRHFGYPVDRWECDNPDAAQNIRAIQNKYEGNPVISYSPTLRWKSGVALAVIEGGYHE